MSSDAPPSYESVVARLEQRLGSKPKPQDVLDTTKQLPQYEIDILISNAGKIVDMTPDQKTTFTIGVAREMSSKDAALSLRTAAADATAACSEIEVMFTNLMRTLASIDAMSIPPKEGAFVPRFRTLNQMFRQIVHDSKDLAVKIAVYGLRFDSVIIPICKDTSLTIEKRKEKIGEFIKDADTFSDKAAAMEKSLNNLKSDFAVFIGSFSGWASDKEGADTKELEQARKDLDELRNELSKLRVALFAVGGVAAASLPVTGILALLSGPFAPIVIIGGLIFAGVSTSSVVGLAIAIDSKKKQVEAKQARIDALVQSINDIKATREKLELLGTENLKLFNQNVSVMTLLWTSAHNDALEIKTWLEGGAKDADMPEYMLISVNEAVSIYKTMADYLRQYADGIASINIPKP
ncbi:hypothetical protein DFH11DRAFT_1728648 [Phellopilus nigrolimitatus]|nr:hypothetical protein DFH11DRAFT_1728648 [Phellopilus nigrolimitatus]